MFQIHALKGVAIFGNIRLLRLKNLQSKKLIDLGYVSLPRFLERGLIVEEPWL